MSFTSRRLSEENPLRTRPSKAAASPAPPTDAALAAVQERRMRLLKRVLTILFSVLLGLMLLAGAFKVLVAMKILSPMSIFNTVGSDLPTDADGFTNILLLGTGDKTHDGVDLRRVHV
jgi:hypothetical protein